MKINTGYYVTIFLFILINTLILSKWINADYNNNYAGGILIPFLGLTNIILNIAFLIGFIIAGMINRKRRNLYLLTALFALVPLGILFFTG